MLPWPRSQALPIALVGQGAGEEEEEGSWKQGSALATVVEIGIRRHLLRPLRPSHLAPATAETQGVAGTRRAALADLDIMKDTSAAPYCQRTGCFSIGSRTCGMHTQSHLWSANAHTPGACTSADSDTHSHTHSHAVSPPPVCTRASAHTYTLPWAHKHPQPAQDRHTHTHTHTPTLLHTYPHAHTCYSPGVLTHAHRTQPVHNLPGKSWLGEAQVYPRLGGTLDLCPWAAPASPPPPSPPQQYFWAPSWGS